MTTKWADYVITCVNYTADGTRIATVGVWTHEGTQLTNYQTWHRQQVVDALGDNKTFVTATKNTAGLYEKGAAIQRYVVNREWFIQTVANSTAKDNLGSLPSCT